VLVLQLTDWADRERYAGPEQRWGPRWSWSWAPARLRPAFTPPCGSNLAASWIRRGFIGSRARSGPELKARRRPAARGCRMRKHSRDGIVDFGELKDDGRRLSQLLRRECGVWRRTALGQKRRWDGLPIAPGLPSISDIVGGRDFAKGPIPEVSRSIKYSDRPPWLARPISVDYCGGAIRSFGYSA